MGRENSKNFRRGANYFTTTYYILHVTRQRTTPLVKNASTKRVRGGMVGRDPVSLFFVFFGRSINIYINDETVRE